MSNLQKMGGYSSLINGLAYLLGIALVFGYMAPIMDAETEEYVAFIADNQTLMFIWHLVTYLVAGVCMVPLVLAMHERLKEREPALMLVATATGLIWVATIVSSGMIMINNLGIIEELYNKDPAQATTAWISLSAISEGLGGAIELPGGLWFLLISWIALKSGKSPKVLNYFGILVGLGGILTVVPVLYASGYVFGLGAIVWFLGMGIVLLRYRSSK